MTDPSTILTESEIESALSNARLLIAAGIPVFAAPPCKPGCGLKSHPPARHHYALPLHWQKTIPAEVNLQKWEPGWALAAIGGFGADFLDVDPRNGGDATARQLRDAGLWPRVFGRQRTPSGGWHEIITPTGQRKGELAPGVDLQSGVAETRTGLGFVYLAPTIGASKVDGTLRPYRWESLDVEALEEWRVSDDSTGHVIHLMTSKRAAPAVPAQRTPPGEIDTEDPFWDASVPGSGGGTERAFTQEQAQDFLRPYLISLQEARVGQIEERANVAAAALSHFVPTFWSAEQAYALLTGSLAHTAYDPEHPASTWTAEKFRPVLDGRRPPIDNWKATRRAEPPAPPEVTVEAEPGQENLSTLEKLRRMLKTAQEMADSPAPEPLVYGLLDLDTEAWLIGAPGSLKSFIALDWAGHVGSGREWHGHRVRKAPVLYIAAEGTGGMVLRTRAWMKDHGDMEGVTFLPYPVQVKSNDGQWEALVQLARELKPGLIVIDTQARVSVGLEENSATDMGVLIAAIGALKRATRACVLTVHHTGRNGQDARGSSALDGAQDTELKVIRAEPRSSLMCKIVQDKQKDMAEGDAGGIPLKLKVVDLGIDPDSGRELSSLVVGGQVDAFAGAQGVDVLDLEPWKGKAPGEWTKKVPGLPGNGMVQRRILQTLADHAHQRGLTQAEALRVVCARWYEAGKKPDADSWTDAWNKVCSTDLAVNVGGERWALDQAALAGLQEAHG